MPHGMMNYEHVWQGKITPLRS